MNKKLLTILVIIPLFSFNSCNKLVVGDDPLANLNAGEIPEGGEKVSYEDAIDILNVDYDAINQFDSVSIETSNADIYSYNYIFDEKTNTKYQESIYDFDGLNASLSIDGLKTVESFSNLKYSFSSSCNLYVKTTEKEYNKTNYRVKSYLKDRVIYNDLSDSALKLFNLNIPNKHYIEIDEKLDIVLNKLSGEYLPFFSLDTYLKIKESIFDTLLDRFNNKQAFKQYDFSYILYDHFYTLNKYDNKYLLTINIDKELLNNKIPVILDTLYQDKFLDLLLNHEVTAAEYDNLKLEVMDDLKPFIEYFNYFKSSTTISGGFISDIAIDYDYQIHKYTYDGNNYYHNVNENKCNMKLSFNYGKGIDYSSLNTDEYSKHEINYYSEEFVKVLNYLYKNNKPVSLEEFKVILGEPATWILFQGTGVAAWIKGFDNINDANEAYENGETLYRLEIILINNEYREATFYVSNKNNENEEDDK